MIAIPLFSMIVFAILSIIGSSSQDPEMNTMGLVSVPLMAVSAYLVYYGFKQEKNKVTRDT